MFTYIRLKNYKSFKDVMVDFRDKQGNPKPFVCIYGENGSGKSNLASAFHFLKELASTRVWLDDINEFMEKFDENSEEMFKRKEFYNFIRERFRDVDTLIKSSKLIGSKDSMKLEYGIKLEEGEGAYSIELSDSEIINEELEFTLNKRKTIYFSINKDDLINPKLNKSIFTSTQYKFALKNEIKKYWGKHSFISILLYELKEKNIEYIGKNINKKMLAILEFIYSISTKCMIGNTKERGFVGYESNILADINEGEIDKKYYNELIAIEEFLTEIFTALYSDIKNVYYEIDENEKNNFDYKLVFKKMISGELIDVYYNLESTGTLSLLKIIPYLVNCLNNETVIVDEIDTGIHDILFKNLIDSFKEYINGQFIMTTHNTYIMESVLEPKDVYVIYIDPHGNKDVRCLANFDKIRIRNSNNLRLRYMKGIYGGVPDENEIDFECACKELLEKIVKNKKNEI